MYTSVNASNKVDSVGADIAFDDDPKFFACLVRFECSSVPTTLPTAYDVYPLDGRHDGGYYTVKDGVTIDVVPRAPANNVFFSSRSRHTRSLCDWSSDVCSSDLGGGTPAAPVYGSIPRGKSGRSRGAAVVTASPAPRAPALRVPGRAGSAHWPRHPATPLSPRSEERRVGKEGRSRWSPYH